MSKNLQSIDIKPLLLKSTRNYDFVLDGTHFGRGNIYISEYEQVKYKYNAVSLKKWKVNENENTLKEISPDIIEHFYSNESYVIYAKYLVSAFDLNSGNAVNNPDDVKEVYFYWRGAYAAKGCSPLPKELNVEDIPVERICQWSEPPVFLRLFNGKFIVHNKSYSKEPHLYMQCGTVTEEAHFLEVPNEKRSLRSRTSFLLVLPLEHEIYIWHGSKACNYSFCENILLSLQNNGCSIYDIDSAKDFHVTEVKEQQNDGKFLGYLHGDVNDYFALANEAFTYQHTPRLFYLNNITGEFTANEIEYTLGGEYLNAFPFLQDHLYTAPQPALFLLDNNHELWLWQGWKTKATTEEQLLEFEKQRLCALDTAIGYWTAKNPALESNIYLVAAGREPPQFTNIFPFWTSKNTEKDLEVIAFCETDKYPYISTKFF